MIGSMNILHYILHGSTSEIVINQSNDLFGTIYITILDFTYILYYNIVANMAHIELSIAS